MSATPVNSPASHERPAEAFSVAPIFQDLPEPVVAALRDCVDYRSYGVGQTVFTMGQFDGGEFFIVLSGRLRFSTIESGTGAMRVEEFGPNEVFALEFAFIDGADEALAKVEVTAADDASVAAIDSEAFRAIAAQRPSLMRNVAAHLAKSLSEQRFKSVIADAAPRQRVLAALLKFVARDGVAGEWRIERMPKHRELADAAGVEEPAAASAVAELIQDGVVRRDYPGLVVCDLDRLAKLAGQG